ncbi:MAG: hypothetical protein EGS78_00510 [Bacteroidales bacterium]|nr:hypothetical protein [Bacteroidales bacterium]
MLSAAVSVTSCLNEDYDLTKDIDTNISIDGDISAPLGNSELILVDDFLNLGNDGEDVLKTDASGNYYVSVTGRGTSSDVELPVLSFSDELVTDGGYIARIKKSELPLPSSGAVPAEQYTKHFNVSSTPMTVNEDVPHEIRAVKDAEVSGVVNISLTVTTGKATLSDLIIDFPEYLEFADVKDAGLNFNPDGNLLTIKRPQISTMAKNYYLNVVGIDFDKIPSGQGFLPSQHKIVLNDEIKLSAFDVNAVLSDLGTTVEAIPNEIVADIGISISSLIVKTALVKVDPDIVIDPFISNVGELPDFLSGDDVVLDLYNPVLKLNIDNHTPLKLNLNADIMSYKGADHRIAHVGNANGGEAIALTPSGMNRLYVSKTGEGVPAGFASVVVPDFSSLISIVPDRIGVENIDVEAADEFVTLTSGGRYNVVYDFELAAALAFGKDVKIVYSTDFTGWNETFNPNDESFALEIRDADVKFDFVNMIPMTISLDAAAIDVDGNVIPGIKVTLNGDIPAGSVEKPSTSALTLNLEGSAEQMRKLDGLRLNLTGSDPGTMSGVCLNKNQGVQFKNMKIRLQAKMDIESGL